MNDSQQNLVEVRRSSGQKEWMTKEQLEALNKQHALKRETSKGRIKQSMSRKKWTGISVSLNVLLLIALSMLVYYSPIGLTF